MMIEKSGEPERLDIPATILSLDEMADKLKAFEAYVQSLPPLKLRMFEIKIPNKPQFPEEIENAQRICDIFWRAAERLRPPKK